MAKSHRPVGLSLTSGTTIHALADIEPYRFTFVSPQSRVHTHSFPCSDEIAIAVQLPTADWIRELINFSPDKRNCDSVIPERKVELIRNWAECFPRDNSRAILTRGITAGFWCKPY
jgi:hypothetical protein